MVRFLAAGQSFGESAALHDKPCPVKIVAMSDSMVIVLPPLGLLRLLEEDARFARNLVRLLSEKFLGLLRELESKASKSALQRLAGYLAPLAERDGRGGMLVRLPATKTAVAARLGITKETLSRLLRQLAERQLVVIGRKEIQVRNLAGLESLAN